VFWSSWWKERRARLRRGCGRRGGELGGSIAERDASSMVEKRMTMFENKRCKNKSLGGVDNVVDQSREMEIIQHERS
jgi:hypothetical protein